RNLGSSDRAAISPGEFHAKGIAPLPGCRGIRGVLDCYLSLWSIHCRRGAGARRRWRKRTHCRLKLAFGIDEEIRRRYDAFPRLEPFRDNYVIVGACSDFDLARLK